MRCSLPPHSDCPTTERCEIEGCRRFLEPGVPAKPREPVDLNYQPGRIVRGLMALTDRTERAVRRGPTPFAPAPAMPVAPSLEEPAPVSATAPPPLPPEPPETIAQVLASANLPPGPQPKPAPSSRSVSEIRARRIGSGWLLYANGQEVDIATDGSIPGLVADLARR